MRWDYADNRIQVQAATRWVEEGDPRWERNHMYVDELRAVASAIEGHQQRNQLTTGEQGAAVLSVALAALRSATDGNAIDLCNTDAVTRAWLSSLNCP
jgi:predicted dehydrogenase